MSDDHLLIGENVPLSKAVFHGTGLHLRDYVVSIFDRDSHDVCAGTLIRLEDRLFVATACHVIPKNPVGRLWLMNLQGRYEAEGIPGFLKWGRHPDKDKDVGYLELDPATSEEYFGHNHFCLIGNLADLSTGREGRPAVVTGTPAEKVVVSKETDAIPEIRIEVMPYWTIPLTPEKWPEVPEGSFPPNPDVDVFMNYPEEECLILETNEKIILPKAKGMSGGGMWDAGVRSDKRVWSPEDCKLFAIQGSWSETRRYLRGTQIRHWVDLVHNDYPDLRPLLDYWASQEIS